MDFTGYYKFGYVPDALAARVVAIRGALPPAQRLIDLGCNDGTISLALLDSGQAQTALGIDLEDVRSEEQRAIAEFEFIAADLRNFDLATLPEVDAILCLNLVHHLCLNGIDFARRFLEIVATKTGVVFLDMGSLTAQIDPRLDSRWLQVLRATWPSDWECWADLFRPFAWRRPLLTYPFQQGRRVLWKLATAREPAYEFDAIEKTPTATKLRRRFTEELFLAKPQSEDEGEDGGEDTAARSRLHEFLRGRPFDCLLPLMTHPEYGEIYPYDPEIAAAPGFSFSESIKALSPAEFLEVRRFAAQPVPGFGDLPLDLVCDFRVQKTSRGLTFFHFAPRSTGQGKPA